jgi:hypothetical protein
MRDDPNIYTRLFLELSYAQFSIFIWYQSLSKIHLNVTYQICDFVGLTYAKFPISTRSKYHNDINLYYKQHKVWQRIRNKRLTLRIEYKLIQSNFKSNYKWEIQLNKITIKIKATARTYKHFTHNKGRLTNYIMTKTIAMTPSSLLKSVWPNISNLFNAYHLPELYNESI